jgi:hypothetical protein
MRFPESVTNVLLEVGAGAVVGLSARVPGEVRGVVSVPARCATQEPARVAIHGGHGSRLLVLIATLRHSLGQGMCVHRGQHVELVCGFGIDPARGRGHGERDASGSSTGAASLAAIHVEHAANGRGSRAGALRALGYRGTVGATSWALLLAL